MSSHVGDTSLSRASSAIFPQANANYILAFQFSSWFPSFSSISIRSTIIRPLDQSFKTYLESDGVFVPEGSEDVPAESTLSDDEEEEREDSDRLEPEVPHFAFPELDASIRAAIDEYQAVFPKLNFSSPKDAAWVLPMSSPLKCTSPAEVYLLLKSSDFITHDLNVERVFEGCGTDDRPSYDLELVLRKWYPVDRGREMRCFVRNDTLLGITQRDMNFYDFMIDPLTQRKIKLTICSFWEEHIRPSCEELTKIIRRLSRADIFDLLLTRDLSRAHVLDFNPYAPRTDPLLFDYEELHDLFIRETREHGIASSLELPELRVVDSPMHLAATRNAPAHQHNMVPMEALNLSEGKSITEFSEIWKDAVERAMKDDEKDP